jgi:hypothetical protein
MVRGLITESDNFTLHTHSHLFRNEKNITRVPHLFLGDLLPAAKCSNSALKLPTETALEKTSMTGSNIRLFKKL